MDRAKKPSIPSWQQTPPASTALDPPPSADDPTPQADNTAAPEAAVDDSAKGHEPLEGKSLLEQAKRFLEEPSIRGAPRERKVAFLASKGVSRADVEKLLGPLQHLPGAEPITDAEKTWGKPHSQPSPSETPRQIPPIVTYPEFLTQPAKPPPLITASRILNTAYATAALGATIYGLSNYIVAPMVESLNEARHDLASQTITRLDELNAKLKDMVSIDPSINLKPTLSQMEDDAESIDSDPTELFHRDFGTQTTPSLSRRPSVSSVSSSGPSTTASHELSLNRLRTHLHDLESSAVSNTQAADSLTTQLRDVNSYLMELRYQNPTATGYGLYGAGYGADRKAAKDDAIEQMKNDIRSVKGVLLSARNFPAGGARVVGSYGRIGS